MTTAVVVGCALGSALAAAASSVLQHRAARLAPRRAGSVAGFLRHLLGRPGWLLGLAVAALGLALHAAALSGGRLSVVQPLLVCGVLFALPASVILEGRRPTARQHSWAFALVAALTAFLLVADPTGGAVATDTDTLAVTTLIGTGAILATTGCGIVLRRHRAVLIGVAAGLGYGVAAALLKQSTALARTGVGPLMTDWPIYTVAGVGALAIALTQFAYRAGPLAASLPALTIADPASSVLIGVLAFHEDVAHSAVAVTIELVSFVVMGVATARLAQWNGSGDRRPA